MYTPIITFVGSLIVFVLGLIIVKIINRIRYLP